MVEALVSRLSRGVAGFWRVLKCAEFRSPAKAPVMIFDPDGGDILEKLILSGIEYTSIEARGEKYYLSPHMLWRIAVNLRKYESRDIAYYASCIDVVRPRVVMTYVDNSNRFQILSRCYRGPSFIAVQNGSRDARDIRPSNGIAPTASELVSMTNFYCFGQFEEDMYKEFGHQVDDYHKIGSIRLSYYRTNIRHQAPAEEASEFDICLISNYKWEIMEQDPATWSDRVRPIYTYTEYSQALLDEYLARYVKERGLKLCIAGNRPPFQVDLERRFFERVYGPDATFIPGDKASWSTFKAIENSRLSVCYNSTAGFEALGLGRKSLFVNFTGIDDLDPPRPGPWTFTVQDYEAFARHVDEYLEMDPARFTGEAEPFVSYLFGDFGRFDGYKILRQHLTARLAG